MPSLRVSRALLLFLLLACTFVVYQSGLQGDFEFDDHSNITDNVKLVMDSFSAAGLYEAAMSSYSGVLKRPVSMLSFALNASTTGLSQPLYFKLTNLFIHLANGALVYWLTGLLLARLRQVNAGPDDRSSSWIQLVTTGAWLLHPLNLTSVLYVVQRMTSLSATFALLAVVFYILGRERMVAGRRLGWTYLLAGLVIGGTLSTFAKENGVLVPVLLLVVEFVFFRFSAAGAADSRRLKALFIVTVVLPAAAFVFLTATMSQTIYVGYQMRDFDMADRLLTQPRVIWFYLRLVFLPAVSLFGMFHDDFVVSHSVFSPADTLPAIVGLAALFAAGLLLARRLPALSFGILWFLAGHLLESTTLPLEMVHEHRNYLPVIGIIFAFAYYACVPGVTPDSIKLRRMAAVAMMALFTVVTAIRAEQWGSLTYHSLMEAQNHPDSERANQQLGRILFLLFVETKKADYYAGAYEAFERARHAKSISVVPHASLLQLYEYAGKPVDPTLIPEFAQRLETLPVAPSVVPAMRTLVDCQIYAYCKLPDADIVRLFDAVLRNPRGHVSITTSLRVTLAQYYADKMGDVVAAVNTLEEAKHFDPTQLDIYLNLSRLYRLLKQFDRAEKHLVEASSRDRYLNRQSEIDEERKKLVRDRLATTEGRPVGTVK